MHNRVPAPVIVKILCIPRKKTPVASKGMQDPHAMVKADCGASLIPRRMSSGPVERTPDIDVSLYLDLTQRLSVPSTGKASSNELLEGDVWATYGVLGRIRSTEHGITYGRKPMAEGGFVPYLGSKLSEAGSSQNGTFHYYLLSLYSKTP
jgi:hypothetical protein